MIKLSKDNVGLTVMIKGTSYIISEVLANQEKFRVKQPVGEMVVDYSFVDIESTKGLVIDII